MCETVEHQASELNAPEVIRSRKRLREYLGDKPALRRWYIARVFKQEPTTERGLAADVLFAQGTDQLYKQLNWHPSRNTMKEKIDAVSGLDCDNLDWWESEDFEHRVHLSVASLRKMFRYENEPLQEGMVFIEIMDGRRRRFVPFTFQARGGSKEVVRKLLNPGVTDARGQE